MEKAQRIRRWAGVFAVLGLVLFPSVSTAVEPSSEEGREPSFVANEILVKLRPAAQGFLKRDSSPSNTGIPGLDRIHAAIGAERFEPLVRPGNKPSAGGELELWHKATFKAKSRKGKISEKDGMEFQFLQEAVALYRKDPNILAAEPNGILYAADVTPNDPRFSELWGMAKIQAPQAWSLNTGSPQVVVAVIDTGIEYTHPDLAANMWTNPGEIPGNQKDDDGNGYVDDVYGYDFFNNDGDPMDDHFHGSHVAGTIGAVGNNATGVVGVNWTVKLMAMKFLSSSGSGSTSAAVSAIQYAMNNGAHILSNSWGGGGYSQALQDAITAANNAGVLFVAAAGNDNTSAPFYPAAMDGVVAVAATDSNDQKASFSNYGSYIDLAAPGVNVLSCNLGGTYRLASGTSMACPHVSGLAALIKARNFSLLKDQILTVLQNSVDDLGALGRDDTYGYGRINANRALSMVSPDSAVFPVLKISSPVSGGSFSTPIDVIGTAAGSTFAQYRLEVAPAKSTAWILVQSGVLPVTDGLLGRLDPTGWADGPVVVRLTVTDNRGADFYTLTTLRLVRAELTSPKPYDEMAPNSIPILGTASGPDFLSYTLEYGAGLQTQIETAPLSWIKFQESGSPVVSGLLGTLNLPAGSDGYTTLRLTVRSASGTLQRIVPISAEGAVLPGWPVTLPLPDGISGLLESRHAVAMARVGNQTRLFVPFSRVSGSITAGYVWIQQFQPDGKTVAGWPPRSGNTNPAFSPVAVGDLDRDNNPEIAVTVVDSSLSQWWLFVLRSDGTTLWARALSRTGSINAYTISVDLVPTLEDLNSDGYLDVVVGGDESGSVQAFDRFGNTLPGFPIVIRNIDTTLAPPSSWPQGIAVADLDSDGRKELAFSARTKDGVTHLYIYRSDGTPYPMAQPILSVTGGPVVIGDINGDGRLDLIAPTPSGVGAWRPDGTPLPGWPKTGECHRCVLGDLNNDKIPEVVTMGPAGLYAYKGDGSLLPGWPVAYLAGGTNPLGTDPLIADVNGDGKADVLVKRSQSYPDGLEILRIYAYDAGGQPVPGFPKQLSTPGVSSGFAYNGKGSPALADFNGDGVLDLAAATELNWKDLNGAPANGRIKVWSLMTSTSNANIQWGKDRGDLRNTGLYAPADFVPPTVSITAPAEGSTVAGTLQVTATASDNVGISNVEFYVDGVLKAADPSSPYGFAWDTTTVTNGSHLLSAKAYDAAGNVGTSASVTVSVNNLADTTPPTVLITSPLNNSSVPNNGQVSIMVSATDNVGVTRVEIRVDGVLKATLTTAPYTTSWNGRKAASGPHTITATAFDAAGNTTSASVTVNK